MVWSGFYFQVRLGQVFGVVPWLNLKTFKPVDKIPYNLCPVIPAAILFLEQLVRLLTSKKVTGIPLLILDFLKIYSLFRSTYIKKKEWKRLLQLYEVINNQIRPRLLGSLDLGYKPVVIIFFYTLLLLSSRILSHHYNPRSYSFFVDLTTCITLIQDSLTIYLSSTLVKGLKILNRQINHLVNEKIVFSVGGKTMNAKAPTFCRNLYSKLYEMSVCINDIFNWLIGSSLILFLIKLCIALQKMIHMISTSQLVTNFVIRFALSFVYRAILTFHVIMSCDAATAEAAKTYRICVELMGTTDEETIKFIKFVKRHRVYFTAANFFEINRRTILSIANIMTNYLIVLLQLNRINF